MLVMRVKSMIKYRLALIKKNDLYKKFVDTFKVTFYLAPLF